MFDRYTLRARRIVYLAKGLAEAARHPQATDAHLMLGIMYEHESSAARTLTTLGLTCDSVADAVYTALQDVPAGPWASTMPLSPRLHTVLQDAAAEAISLGAANVSTGHLLLALALERDSDGRGSAVEILKRLGADPADVREVMLGTLRGDDSEQAANMNGQDHDTGGHDHDDVAREMFDAVMDRLDGLQQELAEHVGDGKRIQRHLGLVE